jgi:hypothetical protein
LGPVRDGEFVITNSRVAMAGAVSGQGMGDEIAVLDFDFWVYSLSTKEWFELK